MSVSNGMSAYLVANKFEQLLTAVCFEPKIPFEALTAERLINERLRRELSIKRCIMIGSFASQTAIPGYSDIDFLVELRGVFEDRHPHSILVLLNDAVSRATQGEPTEIRCPAVVFTIGDSRVEIVPACECISNDQFPVYLIADSLDGWKASSPELHIADIDRRDRDFKGVLRGLIRLAKLWKYQWCIPLSSYQIERVVLNHALRLCALPYDRALHELFVVLSDADPESLLDRVTISAAVAHSRDQQAQDVRTILLSSLENSRFALIAAEAADCNASIALWNRVFRGYFSR